MIVKAMILAAGRGERMRPLTDTCPKPLLSVQGRTLISWQLLALQQGGFDQIVVNTAWLAPQIEHYLDNIACQPASSLHKALSFSYSREGADFGHALETAGGVARALPLLCSDQRDLFWLLAADVFTPGFAFTQAAVQRFADSRMLAHLWLVPNPPQHPQGDFGLQPVPALGPGGALALAHADVQYTYSTIGLYRRALFEPPLCDIAFGNPHGHSAPLAPLLRAAMARGQVSAELYTGAWTDVGTPERLAALDRVGLPLP